MSKAWSDLSFVFYCVGGLDYDCIFPSKKKESLFQKYEMLK
jgi:hypothetical protein